MSVEYEELDGSPRYYCGKWRYVVRRFLVREEDGDRFTEWIRGQPLPEALGGATTPAPGLLAVRARPEEDRPESGDGRVYRIVRVEYRDPTEGKPDG